MFKYLFLMFFLLGSAFSQNLPSVPTLIPSSGYAGVSINYTFVPLDDPVAWSYGVRVGNHDLWNGFGGRIDSSLNVSTSALSLDLGLTYTPKLEISYKPFIGLGGGIEYLYRVNAPESTRTFPFLSAIAGIEVPAFRLSGVRFFGELEPRFFTIDSSVEVQFKTGLHFAL